MFKLTRLITMPPDSNEASRRDLVEMLETAAISNPCVLRSRVQHTLPGVYNGGDFVWHVQFASEDDYHACAFQPAWRAAERALEAASGVTVESAAYAQGSLGIAEPEIRNGIHRTLLLTIRPAIAPEKIGQFEAEMREMAHYIPAIRNWGLSRVIVAGGSRQWSHVWEQEFADIRALNGPYIDHPYHFGHIDRWFDSESPDWIIDTRICHTFCAFDGSMLAEC